MLAGLVTNDLTLCRRHRALVADQIDVLRQRLAIPAPADRCLAYLSPSAGLPTS